MRQQINLYQPIFSEERKLFSAITVAVALLVLLGALAAYSANAHLNVRRLAAEVDALRLQQSQQEALLIRSGERELPETVEARVKRLETLVAERGQALEVLRSGAAGTTIGFAPRLEALARRHIDGLWIDSVQLSGSNGAMSLSGATHTPDMVPAYLRSLAQDEVLAGTRFDDFVIERPTTSAADEDAEAKPATITNPKLVRFRAGSNALKDLSDEAST